MRTLALALALAALPANAHAAVDPARTLVDAFVRALTSDNPDEVTALTDSGDRDRLAMFREYLGGFECVSVRGYRFERVSKDSLHLEIDADAITRGATHRRVALHPGWLLDVTCDAEQCRLHRVETEEGRAARLMVEIRPADWNNVELCDEFDPSLLAREMATAVDAVALDHGTFMTISSTDPHAYAIGLARRFGDRSAEAAVWSRVSSIANLQGRREFAMEAAKAGVAAADASGDHDAMAAARFRLGITSWLHGNNDLLEEACESLGEAAAMADAVDDARLPIRSLYMQGYIERMRGDLRDYLLHTERVIQLSSKYHSPGTAANASISIAELHLETNDVPVAVEYFRAAYKYALEAHDEARAPEALTYLTIARIESGDRSALADIDRLLAAEGVVLSIDTAIQLGSFLTRSGRLAESEKILAPALENARQIAPAIAEVGCAIEMSRLRLAQHRPADALVLAEEALAGQARIPAQTLDTSPWPALLEKGKDLAALGRKREAIDTVRASVDAVESWRETASGDAAASARLFEGRTEPYRELVDLLVRDGNAAEAFRYAERMKGRALWDVLVRGNVDRQADLTATERVEERNLTKDLADWNKAAIAQRGDEHSSAQIRTRVAAARMALDRFEARMEIAHPIRRVTRANPENRTFPQDLGGGAAVEYVVGEHHTIAFAVSRAANGTPHVTVRTIPITKRLLEDRVRRLERRVAQRDLRWTRSVEELDKLLLAPLENELHGRRLICVVPDGVLWRVPFHLLLLDRAAVFYAPSLSILQVPPRRARPPSGELIAFGNPAIGHETGDRFRALARDAKLGDLPEAESEVRAIAALYGRGKTHVYLRDAARESEFKREAPRFRILHLAAHGILDDHSPMYSAIVLSASRDEADDGLLEAREILAMHIDSQLAVLASCDTAKGHIGAGEGVIGMSWAFLVAGCPTTVVSQWKADSKATEALMIEFYRHLRAGEAPATALRQAQMTIRANPRYEDPLYWAPFIVVGAGMRQLSR